MRRNCDEHPGGMANVRHREAFEAKSMSARFGLEMVGKSNWFAVVEKSKPDEPKSASPVRTVGVCTSFYTARRVRSVLNKCSNLSPALQEDSGSWRLSEGTLYEENLKQVWNLSDLPLTSLLAIYGTAGGDTGNTIVFALSCEDAEFITTAFNKQCEKNNSVARYAWRKLGS